MKRASKRLILSESILDNLGEFTELWFISLGVHKYRSPLVLIIQILHQSVVTRTL